MTLILLTQETIDYESVTESVRDNRAGAVVLFMGTVREFTGDTQTNSLDYEAYRAMAEAKLTLLHEEAMARFPIVKASLVHRIGSLKLGDVCVAIAASSPHRQDAFVAAKWLIDTLKEQVPIWKRENYADGSVEWVHPIGSTEPKAKS